MSDADPQPAAPIGSPAAPPGKRRRPLSAKKRLVFALVTLGVLFGVPELFFQAREAIRSRRKPRLPIEFCEHRGGRLIPGARVEKADRTITINSHGLRGPEVAREKPAGTRRVACVGASTTFGLYAKDDAHTWPALLELELAASTNGQGQAPAATASKVEVLNCGAPGWTSRQSLTNLELTVFALKPDVVVIYHNHNDLLENHTPQYHEQSQLDDWRAVRHVEQSSLLDRSALFSFVKSRFKQDKVKLEKKAALHPDGVAAFERNLRRLVRRCQEQRARTLLCTYPHAYRETYEDSLKAGVPDVEQWFVYGCPLEYPVFMDGLRRYDELVRRVGAETKTPVLDLARLVPNDVKLYVTPIHHSEEGEELIAGLVAKALAEHRLLD